MRILLVLASTGLLASPAAAQDDSDSAKASDPGRQPQGLSQRRANSVRDYMIALGVDPNRLRTISYGKERPVDPASSEEAWSRNRRAVTVVDGGTG